MKERLAVVVAHVDDAEIWAGGTLLKHAGKAEIMIYILRCDDDIRKVEVLHSKEIMMSRIVYIQKDNDLYDCLCEFKPTVLVTHWENDSHPDHAEVFRIVQGMLPKLHIFDKVRPNVYCMETYNWLGLHPYGMFQPSVYIDITDVWKQKLLLINVFKSQPVQHWIDMITRQNSLAGSQVGVKYAECFIQLPVLGVIRCSEQCLRGNN